MYLIYKLVGLRLYDGCHILFEYFKVLLGLFKYYEGKI